MGDDGTIRLDLGAQTVEISDGAGQCVESHSFDGRERNQMFLDELDHFLACLRGEAQPVVGVRDAVMSLRMAIAARESMTTGRTVFLESRVM
jgi:predicted dehydrogenase